MLACGHEKEPFGSPVCLHLRTSREPWINYVKWYTGVGMETELLCSSCADQRESGGAITADAVCHDCFKYATSEIGRLGGVCGRPEIHMRPEPFDSQLRTTDLPKAIGKVTDISPIGIGGLSVWLLLTEESRLFKFDAETGESRRLADVSLALDSDREPWFGKVLRRHLHASPCGNFAAVVNDYGRYGQIIDLRSARVTAELDGGDDDCETVPFSFAFATFRGRTIAIHRTDSNRLDVCDPATGKILTARGSTNWERGSDRAEHDLDYYHGALVVSPNHVRIADDGWAWHPVGIPSVWNLEPWLSDNVWESEDGPTRREICGRTHYWDHALTWLDDQRIAIGGIGDHDTEIVDGARIFDVTLFGDPGAGWSSNWRWCRELTAFTGPAGAFFSDGRSLFSSADEGFSRWDVEGGARTGFLPGFKPQFHHRGAGELVQLVDSTLIRWKTLPRMNGALLLI